MESISPPFFLRPAGLPASLKPALGFRRPNEPNGRRCKALEGDMVLHQFRVTGAAHDPPPLPGHHKVPNLQWSHPHQMP
ncbi:hypothetical protein CGRA01v4_03394 [Colletotrichum graminicola]|nr:hypothetical protein CGRA01v4_03394 [Colletotrichum graminicola]